LVASSIRDLASSAMYVLLLPGPSRPLKTVAQIL
jgi:hypothetical protein